MKKRLLLTAVVCFGLAAVATAASQSWEQQFTEALAEIKQAAERGQQGEGLGYTASQEEMLDEAIGNAMAAGGPACQIMKMAVDEEFNPYPVLLSIYSRGHVDLDEVCMCATEQGVSKAVIAQAAVNASGPGGEPAYSRDEISQCQCLQAGLPYTPGEAENPPQPTPPDPVPPVSASAP